LGGYKNSVPYVKSLYPHEKKRLDRKNLSIDIMPDMMQSTVRTVAYYYFIYFRERFICP